MTKKVKPTSVRLDNELLNELDQRCSKVGCSRNDFIKNSVELAITQQSDFDFGNDEEIEDPGKETTEPQVQVTLVEDEIHGKVWDDKRNIIGTCKPVR